MRRIRHLVVLLLASLAAVAVADESAELRPQHAIVTSPGAPVRSGPGDNYYLTDTLPEQTEVEVYRREPGGWCAIRPPADSFSWVFHQNIRLIDGELGEINKNDVAARVGSRLSMQRDVVQVRLQDGEKVAILGRDEQDGGLWYKIAPPAGEFRWIKAKDIGLASAADRTDEEPRQITTVSLEEPAKSKPPEVSPPPLATAETAIQGDSPTGHWTAAQNPPPADITPIGADAPTSAELADHLRELELHLSRMVAEPPATWNTAPLEQAAEQMLAHADTIADREAVKVTLQKIDRFAAIQRRYANMNGTPTASATSTVASAGASATNPTATAYDAVGILRPVVLRRPGAPQFALVNPQGQVVTFVTPAPDVNLQPYVGQRIGISGSRGYIPEFRRAHVTASRVSPLNERLLR